MTNDQQALSRLRASRAGDPLPFARVREPAPKDFGVMVSSFTSRGSESFLLRSGRSAWRGTREEALRVVSRLTHLPDAVGRGFAYNVVEIINEVST